MIYARTVEAVEIQTKPFLDEVSYENLLKTKFTPVLDAPINTAENIIYCSTFQMAWNQLCDKYASETLEMENAPDYVEKLNSLNKQPVLIDDSSFLAISGAGKKTLTKISKEANKKFGNLSQSEQPPKLNFSVKPDEIVIMSYLYKNIKFEVPFERTHPFSIPIDKHKFLYETFGYDRCGYDNNKDEKDYTGQISVLNYKHDDNLDNQLIIKLTDKSMSDEIYISTLPISSTLEKSYNSIIDKIKSDAFKKSSSCFDTILIPKLNLNIVFEYQPLLNNKILNKSIKNYKIKKAIQKIVFRINDDGQTVMRIKRVGTSVCFIEQISVRRHPFIIFIKNKLKDKPYFVAYIAYPEIFEKNYFDEFGEYDDEVESSSYLQLECRYRCRNRLDLFYYHEPQEYKYKGKDGTNLLILAIKKKKHIMSRLNAIYKKQEEYIQRIKHRQQDEMRHIIRNTKWMQWKSFDDIVKAIANEVNVNYCDNFGSTPLMYAVENDDDDSIRLLLELGANPALKRKDGKDALAIAKDKKNEKIIKLLLKPQK